jgi:hypothetical protein
MIRRARDRQAGTSGDAAAAPPQASAWTPEKVEGVLAALRSFVSNQAMKHGVPAAEVWALVRDEVLDPGGG